MDDETWTKIRSIVERMERGERVTIDERETEEFHVWQRGWSYEPDQIMISIPLAVRA